MGIYGTKNKQTERQSIIKFIKKNGATYKPIKIVKIGRGIFFRFPAVTFQQLNCHSKCYTKCYRRSTSYSDSCIVYVTVTIPTCYQHVSELPESKPLGGCKFNSASKFPFYTQIVTFITWTKKSPSSRKSFWCFTWQFEYGLCPSLKSFEVSVSNRFALGNCEKHLHFPQLEQWL